MRAVIISHPGGPEVLQIGEVERPVPGPQQIEVRVQVAGLNRADLLQRAGRYPPPPGTQADIPGLEFAGVVAAVGSGVEQWHAGDRVFGIIGGAGQAEYVVVDADQVAAIPRSLDPVAAGAVPEVFMTAYDALQQAAIGPGQQVLVHAVGSGVGTAALQLAKARGATVFGTAHSHAKLDLARDLGLHAGFLQDGNAWVAPLLNQAPQGVDVVLDFIGGPMLPANLEVLAQGGRVVVIGTMGGGQGTIDLGVLMRKRATLRGTVLRSRTPAEKAELTAAFARDVVPLLANGNVKPIVDRVFPLAAVADAHRYMESNANFGKIVLAIEGT